VRSGEERRGASKNRYDSSTSGALVFSSGPSLIYHDLPLKFACCNRNGAELRRSKRGMKALTKLAA